MIPPNDDIDELHAELHGEAPINDKPSAKLLKAAAEDLERMIKGCIAAGLKVTPEAKLLLESRVCEKYGLRSLPCLAAPMLSKEQGVQLTELIALMLAKVMGSDMDVAMILKLISGETLDNGELRHVVDECLRTKCLQAMQPRTLGHDQVLQAIDDYLRSQPSV